MSSRRSRASKPAFPDLHKGVQNGLRCLVQDHKDTVSRMLDLDSKSSEEDLLEACAKVIKQQQLSPSAFLARFFDAELLKSQAEVWRKSNKGSAPSIADRIEAAWMKDGVKGRPQPTSKRKTDEKDENEVEKAADLSPSKKKAKVEERTKTKTSGTSSNNAIDLPRIPKKKKG
jgi:hypothetical protein